MLRLLRKAPLRMFQNQGDEIDSTASLQIGAQEVAKVVPPAPPVDSSTPQAFSSEMEKLEDKADAAPSQKGTSPDVSESGDEIDSTASLQIGAQEVAKVVPPAPPVDSSHLKHPLRKWKSWEDKADATPFLTDTQEVIKVAQAKQTDNPSFTIKPSSNRKVIKKFQALKQRKGNPSLSYPEFARRGGMQGKVSILFYVTSGGLVDQIQLESSSGYSELDNFVLQTLARYEFLPGQESWVRHTIPFILDGEEMEHLQLRQQ